MAKQLFVNNASALLAVSIITTDTAIQVASGYGAMFPSPTGGDWFALSLEDNDANTEITKCTARSGDVMTVVRAQEGTLAQAFTNTVTRVELRPTAGAMQRMLQRSGDTLGGDLELGGFAISGPGSIAPDVTIPKSAVFSVGMIMMWSGSAASVPLGWALCNGSSGTPDLRDRFVVGAGGALAVGAVGGSATGGGTTDAGGTHTHTITVADTVLSVAQMPAHSHRVYSRGSNASTTGSEHYDFVAPVPNLAYYVDAQTVGGSAAHTHAGSAADSGGSHTHGVTVATVPPYYALCYIMFTGVGVTLLTDEYILAALAQAQ